MQNQWQLEEAQAKLGELIAASSRTPQEIVVDGRPIAVLLSKEAYERLAKKKPSFVELMRRSPLAGVELDLERDRSPNREFDF